MNYSPVNFPSFFRVFFSDSFAKDRTIVLSVSGGETSMTMAYLVKSFLPLHNVVCIFANTGCENEETLKFVDKCDNEFGLNVVWVESVTDPQHGVGVTHRVTDFKHAYRPNQYKDPDHPFHAHVRKNGIPNMSKPQCSDRLKELAIEHYKKSNGLSGCVHSLGIRDDEPTRTMPKPIRNILANTDVTPKQFKAMEHQHRINAFTSSGYDYSEEELAKLTNYSKKLKKYNLVYLLADAWELDKEDIKVFWESQNFRLGLEEHQGNCQTCWKKSDNKLLLLAKESPEKFEAFDWFEKTYANVKPPKEFPATFFRRHRTAEMIVGEADLYDRFMLERIVKPSNSIQHTDGCGSSCESYVI